VVTVTGNLAEPSLRSVTLWSLQKAAHSAQSKKFKGNSRHIVNPRKIAMLAPTVSPTLKLKFSPEMILILIQCQRRRVRRMLWLVKYWEPCFWGYLQGPRDFLLL
jgi:hypothetical protein